MRSTVLLLAAFLAGCASAPEAPRALQDPTTEPWYGQTVNELKELNRQAAAFIQDGKPDNASELIQKGEPLSARLLAVPRPTLAATEAASDVDQLYGNMLLSNHNYGWARLFFQKNLARWKNWKPQTADTGNRLQQAQAGIAECDRHITE